MMNLRSATVTEKTTYDRKNLNIEVRRCPLIYDIRFAWLLVTPPGAHIFVHESPQGLWVRPGINNSEEEPR